MASLIGTRWMNKVWQLTPGTPAFGRKVEAGTLQVQGLQGLDSSQGYSDLVRKTHLNIKHIKHYKCSLGA